MISPNGRTLQLSLSSCMEKMELPPGFRFVPTDLELIGYLRNKKCKHEDANIITEYDISTCNPDQIPRSFRYGLANESFYYTETRPRHSKGQRRDRKAGSGSWRVTCGSRPIKNDCGEDVGYKKKLVFLEHLAGRKKRKIEWMMDEYSLRDMNDYALCRIYRKADHSKENRRVSIVPIDMNSIEETTTRSEVDPSESIGDIFNTSIKFPPQSLSLRENEANSFVYIPKTSLGNPMKSIPCPTLDNGNNFDFQWQSTSGSFWMRDCPDISEHSTTARVYCSEGIWEDSATCLFDGISPPYTNLAIDTIFPY